MSHTHDVYRWNGSAFHIVTASGERPEVAICGTALPADISPEACRQSGTLADMQQWIVDTPLLGGSVCDGCQAHA